MIGHRVTVKIRLILRVMMKFKVNLMVTTLRQTISIFDVEDLT